MLTARSTVGAGTAVGCRKQCHRWELMYDKTWTLLLSPTYVYDLPWGDTTSTIHDIVFFYLALGGNEM